MPEPSDVADLWRLTVQHSPIGMALVDLDGRLLTVNHAFCTMLGRSAESLLRLSFADLTHPDDIDGDLGVFSRAAAGEIDTFRLRKRYLHADGHIVWGDLSVALVRDQDGGPRHLISQILDVTSQRDREERLEAARRELEQEHRTLEAVFEAVSVGLLLINVDGHYERMNRRHAETMALPFPDGHDGEAGQLGAVYLADGKTLMGKEEMPSYRAVQGEEFDDYTYWVGDDPRTRAAFSTSARQVLGPTGERLGAALAYQEITDLMRAMQVQDEFVSSVSHELRTPLTSMLGYLELLCEHEELPGDVTDQLRVVRRNALRLQALLSDLLDVGQAREDGLRLQRAPADVAATVRQAVEAVRPGAHHRGIGVEIQAPAHLTAVVDERRVRQVVDNLLSNAVKYGDADGTIRIVLRRGRDGVELTVTNTGIGLTGLEAEHVFERFYRGDRALEEHIPGTGLGLDIVSSIVAAHGGTVSVDSVVGRGTTFRVALPEPAEGADAAAGPAAAG